MTTLANQRTRGVHLCPAKKKPKNLAVQLLLYHRCITSKAAHLETCAVVDASKGVEFGDAAAQAAGFVVSI